MSGNFKPIVKTRRALFLLESLNLPAATTIEDSVWEKFQVDELNNDSMFAIERKCRQVGWSFLIAMRGVADAILDARSSVYNSINQKEAQDKIRYAKAIYHNLECPFKLPKIIIDNRTELEFDNGARLVSTASARGIPNSNFFVDEWAWKKNGREIYTASVPIISKGGVFRGGSSTNGASGIFWEIDTESFQQYPDFVRTSTKWWETEAFCIDVKNAKREAHLLDTKARVEKYARSRLKTIFANTILEDFQQEYEAIYVDETTAWITWDEIKHNTSETLLCEIASDKSKIDEALSAINRVAALVQANKLEHTFAVGVDIGRTRNTTEVFAVGLSSTQTYPLRLMLTLDNCTYDDQKTVLSKVLESVPVVKMLIDKNGIGNNLAENISKDYPTKAEGVNFTNESKKLWASDLKMLIQQKRLVLPNDRDLGYQIHSIKRKVTAAKNLVFDTEKNEKHHADKFWALALAVCGADAPVFGVSETERNIFATLSL